MAGSCGARCVRMLLLVAVCGSPSGRARDGTQVGVIGPGLLRICCWFHSMQPFAAHVPVFTVFKVLVADMRDAATFEEGQRRFHRSLEHYQGLFPEACGCEVFRGVPNGASRFLRIGTGEAYSPLYPVWNVNVRTAGRQEC